jgi:inhibitor of cysteine peptidase
MADKLIRTAVMMSFFLVLALFSSCGTQGAQITDANNGEQITIKSGDVITVTLASNPTTGYSWQVIKIDNAILVQDGDHEYEQSPGSEGLVGAGGTETLRFKANGTGKTTLELGYMRPRESVPPIESFLLEVIVH